MHLGVWPKPEIFKQPRTFTRSEITFDYSFCEINTFYIDQMSFLHQSIDFLNSDLVAAVIEKCKKIMWQLLGIVLQIISLKQDTSKCFKKRYRAINTSFLKIDLIRAVIQKYKKIMWHMRLLLRRICSILSAVKEAFISAPWEKT